MQAKRRFDIEPTYLASGSKSPVPDQTLPGPSNRGSGFHGRGNRRHGIISGGGERHPRHRLEAGSTLGAIQSDAAFSLSLPSQETYQLFLDVDGVSVPVATRKSDAGYGSVVAIGSDAAAVDMGQCGMVGGC